MSNQALNWAWKQPVGSALRKAVLVYLADSARNNDWVAWPSAPRIADATCFSKRAVLKALAELRRMGYIEKIGTTDYKLIEQGERYSLPDESHAPVHDVHGDERGAWVNEVHGDERGASNDARHAWVNEVHGERGAWGDESHAWGDERGAWGDARGACPSEPSGNHHEPSGNHHDDRSADPPRWLEILQQDKRWVGIADQDLADIEASYGHLDLTMEAHQCVRWLASSPKGKRRKDIVATWLNWLKRASRDASNNIRDGPSQAREGRNHGDPDAIYRQMLAEQQANREGRKPP